MTATNKTKNFSCLFLLLFLNMKKKKHGRTTKLEEIYCVCKEDLKWWVARNYFRCSVVEMFRFYLISVLLNGFNGFKSSFFVCENICWEQIFMWHIYGIVGTLFKKTIGSIYHKLCCWFFFCCNLFWIIFFSKNRN